MAGSVIASLGLLLGLFVAGAMGIRTEMGKPGLLERRSRALIFPKMASVGITVAMTKAIVGGRPSGLQYSVEFDMNVPLPDTVEGWRPNVLLDMEKPKKAAKPKRRWDWTRTGLGPNITRPKLHQRDPNNYGSNANIYSNTATYKEYFYRSPWQLTHEHWPRNETAAEDAELWESWADVPTWKLNRGYRERRAIFDQLEAMGKYFQLDLRACIKRAMCELQAKFNGQHDGALLMEDLLRIVLTIPKEIVDEKYRNSVDSRYCAQFYAASCPHGVLDFLFWK